MRARSVIVVDPDGDRDAGIVEIEEQRLFANLAAHIAMATLHEAVLHRLVLCDEVSG